VLCRLCDALNSLAGRSEWADSGDAALRTLARWQALRPADPMPWAQRASWLTGLGRRAEAEAAARRSEALGGPGVPSHLGALIRDLRLDDLAAADRDCAAGLAGPDSAAFQEYRWYCEIALRMEGRYREARALLREGRVPRSSLRRPPEPNAYMNGIVDMEMGDGLLAAEEFHRVFPLMRDTSRLPDGYRARYATWALTLSATAAVAGGDTLRARRMVDSIEVFGRQSLYSRDPPLHHFVRGLLESRAGRHEAAVRELRAATVSPAFGYTRINYELARSLLALNRPREAIPVVQAPLHGGLEGEQLYLTRTELHELLAHLFDVVGQRDSAAAHYAVVVRAWRSADPFLRPRYEAARAWLARAGRVAVP
jgi:hypothetical protein